MSLWKAVQTQQWRNEDEPSRGGRSAEYDYWAVKHLLNELHRWDARWEDWFHATGREPIRVIYEERCKPPPIAFGNLGGSTSKATKTPFGLYAAAVIL